MGDIITVYGDVDYDGFYRGEVAGRRGLVPSNFLRPASAADVGPRPRHPRPGAAVQPPKTTMPEDPATAGRSGPAFQEGLYGAPPMPPGTSAPQQRRPGEVPGAPVAQPVDPRDCVAASTAAGYVIAGPPSVDERLPRTGPTFRR